MLVFCRRYFDSYTEFVENLENTVLFDLLHLESVPDEGTLCKEEKRLLPYMTKIAILLATAILPKKFVAGADGTGLQTRKASAYYTKVVGQSSRRGFARLELVVWKTYVLTWELRLLPKDELKMLRSCWKKLQKLPSTLVYDKKGDCEAHHEWLEAQGVRSIAPVRSRARKGRYRRQLLKNFPKKTYGKRNRNENVNGIFKNRYGEALEAYTLQGRRAEIATKITAHNLWQRLTALLQELFNIAYRAQTL